MYDMEQPKIRLKLKSPVSKITNEFWHAFYARNHLRHDPSSFAVWCLENCFSSKNHILELGCGNGRDSFSFLNCDISVVAIDGCQLAIDKNNRQYDQVDLTVPGQFIMIDFSDIEHLSLSHLHGINTVYTRFVLHAIPEFLEDRLLDFSWKVLPAGGRMYHEFRTTQDPLIEKGEVIGLNERLTDHYRRFLDTDQFRSKLSDSGWKELYFEEGVGLAVLGDDDPFVARIIVEKV